MTAISVVIPSLNGADLLARFLPDLFAALGPGGGGHQVVVVDNASTDGTRELLDERFGQVEVVALPENRGFSPAVNAGLETVRHPWVLSLNNDVRVEAGFLAPLLEATRESALFAAVPRILLPRAGGRVESVMEAEFHDGFIENRQPGLDAEPTAFREPRPVFFAVGGCALFHTERLRALGGFDPLYYPVYWEDTDLGYRAWRRGWTVRYVPESIVYHRHRGTLSSRFDLRHIVRAQLKSQLLFHWKNVHDPELLREHLDGILLRILDQDARGERAFLEALHMALADAEKALARRPEEARHHGQVPIRRK